MTVLALLLALAAVGRAEDWAVEPRSASCTRGHFQTLEVTLPNILMHQLAAVPSAEGAAAVRHLAGHPNLKLVISFVEKDLAEYWRRPFDEQPDVLMSYSRSERDLKIAHRVLHLDGRDEQTFIRDRAAQRDLAFAVADSFVHELSHAREREKGGIPHLLEDELLSFYRSLAFTLDALRIDPGFNRLRVALDLQRKMYSLREELRRAPGPARRAAAKTEARRLLRSYALTVTPPRLFALQELAALGRSTVEFDLLVGEAYRREELPSLWADAQERLRVERGRLREYRAIVDKIARLEERMGKPPSDPAPGEATQRLLREDIAFWGDSARLAAARSHYAQALAGVKVDLDERRRRGELKPFAAEPMAIERRYGSKDFD